MDNSSNATSSKPSAEQESQNVDTAMKPPQHSTSEISITQPLPLLQRQPVCIAQSVDIHGEGNFPQGCSFSPDGLCIATTTAADATLRLYNTIPATSTNSSSGDQNDTGLPRPVKEWKTALASNVVGEVIRSYDWYPKMQSSDPATCCLAATGRDQPVQLIDAYTGRIRATYSPINQLDELESPTIVKFSPLGDQIVTAGYRTDRMIQLFDSARPGKSGCVLQLGKTKRSSDGQKGLVSALAFNHSSASAMSPNSLLAVGTYAPGSIYMYDFRQGSQQPAGTIWSGRCVVGHGKKYSKKRRRTDILTTTTTATDDITTTTTTDGDDIFSAAKAQWYGRRVQRGITQLEFDAQGNLYSASRHSDAVLVWDVRMLSGNPAYETVPLRGYTNYAANLQTNQRLEFALDEASSRLWVGGCDGDVAVYDTSSSSGSGNNKPLQTLAIPGCAGEDAVNGLSYSSTYDMLAVATGSRRFPTEGDYDSDEEDSDMDHTNDNQLAPGSLQLYQWNSTKQSPDEG